MAGVKKIKEGAADVEEGSRHMTKTRKAMEKAGNETPWRDLSSAERVKQVSWVLMRLVILLACLYFFICSLGLLEDSFQLVGGKAAGKTFQNNDLITNPIAGLMIGVLATVLVQSSSTSTSIIITMVGTKILNIRFAIPIIMGANIGTSVTNTLVSLAQVSDRIEFRRAFAGATVHDMFNWLSVLVLLPLEVLTHYLERLTQLIVDAIPTPDKGEKGPDMLKAITKPFTKLIVEVNKKVIQQTAAGNDTSKDVGDVLLRWCDTRDVTKNVTHHNHVNLTLHCDDILQTPTSPLFDVCREAREKHKFLDLSNIAVDINYDSQDEEIVTQKITRCENLFAQTDLSDSVTGGILLVSSLIIIFVALYGIVKVLHSRLHGSVTKVIRTKINSDLPGKFAYFTGYIALLVGAGMTMILQSSSVFTSTLTPLVGVGVVTVDRMYPLTLGANIGTTVTGILAALSQDPDDFKDAMHVALCHLFFNISGIVLFYPIPFLRLPVGLAKVLGRVTAKHRWFAILYLIIFFVVLPGSVFALSIAGWVYLGAIAGPLLLIFLVIVIINVIQTKRPAILPRVIRTWDFLPNWMHSLKPVDNVIAKVCRCGFCRKLQEADLGDTMHMDDFEEYTKENKDVSIEVDDGTMSSRNGGNDVMTVAHIMTKEVKVNENVDCIDEKGTNFEGQRL